MVRDISRNVNLIIDEEIKEICVDVLTAKEWVTRPDELRLQFVKAYLQMIRAKITAVINRYDHKYKSTFFQLLQCGTSREEMLAALLNTECTILGNGTICLKCDTDELRKYFFNSVEIAKDRPDGLMEARFFRAIEEIISFIQTAESCALDVRVGAALAHLGRAKDAINELMDTCIAESVKIKFIHLLESGLEFDCETSVADVDMEYGFVWGGECGSKITYSGKEYFAELLNSDCEILDTGAIYIHCENEEMGECFFAACAGYVSESKYKEWFED